MKKYLAILLFCLTSCGYEFRIISTETKPKPRIPIYNFNIGAATWVKCKIQEPNVCGGDFRDCTYGDNYHCVHTYWITYE